MRLHSVVLS